MLLDSFQLQLAFSVINTDLHVPICLFKKLKRGLQSLIVYLLKTHVLQKRNSYVMVLFTFSTFLELILSSFLQVVGWRLVNEEGGQKLRCLWKLRDFKCGVELINRISKVAEAAGHFPNIYLEQPNQVRAELWTTSIGKQ